MRRLRPRKRRRRLLRDGAAVGAARSIGSAHKHGTNMHQHRQRQWARLSGRVRPLLLTMYVLQVRLRLARVLLLTVPQQLAQHQLSCQQVPLLSSLGGASVCAILTTPVMLQAARKSSRCKVWAECFLVVLGAELVCTMLKQCECVWNCLLLPPAPTASCPCVHVGRDPLGAS